MDLSFPPRFSNTGKHSGPAFFRPLRAGGALLIFALSISNLQGKPLFYNYNDSIPSGFLWTSATTESDLPPINPGYHSSVRLCGEILQVHNLRGRLPFPEQANLCWNLYSGLKPGTLTTLAFRDYEKGQSLNLAVRVSDGDSPWKIAVYSNFQSGSGRLVPWKNPPSTTPHWQREFYLTQERVSRSGDAVPYKKEELAGLDPVTTSRQLMQDLDPENDSLALGLALQAVQEKRSDHWITAYATLVRYDLSRGDLDGAYNRIGEWKKAMENHTGELPDSLEELIVEVVWEFDILRVTRDLQGKIPGN